MSLSKVNKQIRNLEPRLNSLGNLGKIPVILSDSKGIYLQEVVNSQRHPENKLYFWCRRGVGVEEQYKWLKDNLATKIQELDSNHITLYIWLGTCDLTEKRGKFIDLRSEDFTTVRHVCQTYKQIYEYLKDYPTISLVFLEIPYYSIYLWNERHDHASPEKFRTQDKKLEHQITEVNKYISQLNTLFHKNSPLFGLDLERNRKHRERSQASYNLNYALYIDGIHPIPELAKLWVIRIALRLPADCQ
ncbi:Hypothetical predicted protein [Mytilus galloprovincialis]|uniref:Uncharacterized protein n=1 Tax=Mytilus galloprovincialis TaxID=29158 RepID=A0A8B6C7C4_MYTGA|nr:Hypothetical predicted protein [Mytilus galloprovincialis]